METRDKVSPGVRISHPRVLRHRLRTGREPFSSSGSKVSLSVKQVALMGLVEELFRQLKLSQMLTRMTVAVEEPKQSRPRCSVSHSAWSHSQGGEVLAGDLRTQFLKEPIRSANSAHEFLGVSHMRREL